MQPGAAVPPAPPDETTPGLAARTTRTRHPEMADTRRTLVHHHSRQLLRLAGRPGQFARRCHIFRCRAVMSYDGGLRRGKGMRGAWRQGHPDEAVPAEPGGPLVVAVRPGRGLLVRGDRDHRRVPAVLLQAEHVAGQLPRLVPQAGRRPDEPGVPVDAGHQLRRARRAADAAAAPLGGAAVHRGGVRAPAAALLHRRVSQAPLAELADLGDAAGAGHGGGPVRHHPPGRHAVQWQPRRARGRHVVGPGHRHAPDAVDLRRGLPGTRDHPAGLLAARGGAAGR